VTAAEPSSSRRRPWLAIVLAAAGLAAAVALTNDALRARIEHGLGMQLRGSAMVAVLDVEGVGEVSLFLNPDDPVITPHMMFHGEWEPKESLWFVRSLKPGSTVVDIGANTGYYTVLAGKLVGDQGRVYAFEPDPVSFSLLERNVRLNGLTNVVLEQKAVSNEPGSIRLYLSEDNKGDHRIYQPADEDREAIEIEAVTLDDYFADDPRRIDFIKLDTQGAEVAILRGMPRILAANENLRMAVEFWPSGLEQFGYQTDELLEILEQANFRLFDLAGPRRSPLREVSGAFMQSRYSRHHGDLFVVKRGPGLTALTSQAGIKVVSPAPADTTASERKESAQ